MHGNALQAGLLPPPITKCRRYVAALGQQQQISEKRVAKIVAAADSPELALSSCKKMLGSPASTDDHACGHLLREFCTIGRTDLVSDLLADLGPRGIALPDSIYTDCIQAFGRAGQTDAAVDLLHSMQQPDRIASSAAMYWLCRSRRMPEAMNLLHQMRSDHHRLPDVITYNTIIFGHCSCGDLDQALRLLRSMITDDSPDFCKPNVVTYGTVILALCKNHRAADAFEVFNTMMLAGLEPDSTIYSTLIDCLCWLRHLNQAVLVFEKISDLGCPKNSFIYRKLICSHVKSGRFEEAMGFFTRSVEESVGLELSTVNLLISGLVKSGRFTQAVLVFKDVKNTKNFDTLTYNLLLSACSKEADFESAWEIYWDMQKNECMPDLVTFHTILHAMRRAGRMGEYEKVVAEMNRCEVRVSEHAVKVIVFGLIRLGLVDEGFEFLREKGDCATNEACYWLLVWKFCKAKEFRRACDVVVGMRELRVAVCSLVLNKLIDAGREGEIQRLVAELVMEGFGGEDLCEMLKKKQRRNILRLVEVS